MKGYTFYHSQDTEHAAEGQGLYLAYGTVEGGEAEALAVGRLIATTLEAGGLGVDWDGSLDSRIFVEMEWKKRL